MEFGSKIRTAIRDPSRVPPYLSRNAKQAVSTAATWKAIAGAPSQKSLLEDLRETDSWLLIVLDACRYPEFSEVASATLDGNIQMMATEGHDTFEYVRKCWSGSYPDVTYLSGATPVNSGTLEFDDEGLAEMYEGFVPDEHIGEIMDVWQSGWDERLGVIPPWNVTPVARDHLDDEHLVVHYFQPHAPYVGVERELGHHNDESATPGDGEPFDAPLWRRIKDGKISQARLFELYRSNLEAVIYQVAQLIDEATHDNIVIMGDHGEALGEYWTYAHPRKNHPYILTAPWMEVTGLQSGWRSKLEVPDVVTPSKTVAASVESRLRELGYT